MGLRHRLSILGLCVGALVCGPALALDVLPPDLQRAQDYGAVAHAAAMAFDGNPIEGVVFVREGAYRVWSDTCSTEVTIGYEFDETEPLLPPDMRVDVGDVECDR